jgi:hypothetical protein
VTEQEARATVEAACQRAGVTLEHFMFYPIVPTGGLPINGSVFRLHGGFQVVVLRAGVVGSNEALPANTVQYPQDAPPSELERAAYDYAVWCKERVLEA